VATLTLSAKTPVTVPADAVVVAVAAGPDGPRALTGTLPASLAHRLRGVLGPLGVTGAADDVHRVPSEGALKAPVVVLTGVGPLPGPRSQPSPEALRRAAGAATRTLAGTATVALALPTPDDSRLAAVAEGALLGAYGYTRYRTAAAYDGAGGAPKPPVVSVILLTETARGRASRDLARRAQVLADAVTATRDLVNTPPSDLYPQAFAELAVAATADLPVTVTVLDEKKLAKGGYGGILGVGKGSVRPPRLVRLEYSPAVPRGTARMPHVALVGKGITFDTGGISLKPPAGMELMKSDMAGAAAVLNTVVAAAALALPVRLTAFLALAENMPSGTAQRPSDVITMRGGRTVEVLNTDAEGRLVMADALVDAVEAGPDLILDVATLTGAQKVALGERVSAVMANDDTLRTRVHRAAEDAGELFWPMPLPPELRAGLDSSVADIANIGERFGGMLVAGVFLAEFVGGLQGPARWAHLDIASPAYNEKPAYGYTPAGGTGVAVRTLLTLVEDVAAHGTGEVQG
jgi:leucyl aminopeptidase